MVRFERGKAEWRVLGAEWQHGHVSTETGSLSCKSLQFLCSSECLPDVTLSGQPAGYPDVLVSSTADLWSVAGYTQLLGEWAASWALSAKFSVLVQNGVTLAHSIWSYSCSHKTHPHSFQGRSTHLHKILPDNYLYFTDEEI